jgi:hypothetical protein
MGSPSPRPKMKGDKDVSLSDETLDELSETEPLETTVVTLWKHSSLGLR